MGNAGNLAALPMQTNLLAMYGDPTKLSQPLLETITLHLQFRNQWEKTGRFFTPTPYLDKLFPRDKFGIPNSKTLVSAVIESLDQDKLQAFQRLLRDRHCPTKAQDARSKEQCQCRFIHDSTAKVFIDDN